MVLCKLYHLYLLGIFHLSQHTTPLSGSETLRGVVYCDSGKSRT
jgi:hypothetical protein